MTDTRARRFLSTTIEVEGREEHKIVELPDRELAPWGPDERLDIVGKPLPRVDALEKVTGAAIYTADLQPPGTVHAVLVRSAIPHGRVVSIDFERARQVRGFLDAIAHADLPRDGKPIRAGGVRLFDPAISYAGQPLACVCAESLGQARAAAAAVRIEYAPAEFAVTAAGAVAGDAPAVRPKGGNISRSSPDICGRGDVERGLADADVIVRARYTTPSALHSAMEPHGAVAQWHGDRLTIHEGTQGIFAVRDEVAAGLGLPRSRVRVVMEHMGGGFGAKNHAGAHTYAAAILARRTGRPVRCVLGRAAEQSDTGHRAAARIDVTLGARRDGTLTAIVVEALVDQGISGWEASTTKIFHELYACPYVHTTETFAYTNTQAMAAFRGPGHTEGCFALERSMDELARQLAMDPLALRLHNHADHDQEKSRPYSGGNLRRCLEEGARRFGWGNRGQTPISRYRRGQGLAAQIWPAGGGPPAYATVRIHPDGSIDVLAGTQDLGTGARTILAQVAAEALGARVGDVRVILGDTERTPYTGNSWGSMTTPSVAPAVRMAAEEARERLIEAASEILGVAPEELSVRGGTIIPGNGDAPVAISDVTAKLGEVTIIGNGSRGPNERGVGLMTFGAQFAEVEVDTWTGVVRVIRLTAVHDVGRVLNPLLARSQLEGGILQGLGLALFEEGIIDERLGLPLNTGLHEYKVPTMADVPAIDAVCLDAVDTVANPVGARGLAEPPIIPTAPAVANAVSNALGVPVNDLPITPWRVLDALR
ncbi:MAG TPA: xanthine dehydrogenase family protein molybdopterin-binding subunit, partial [Gemmatimonadaceae bacterium]